jgi:hypothetical protein
MSNLRPFDDDFDHEVFDDDDVDDDDLDDESLDDDTFDTVPCPACGSDVFEDAERCPICGEYITRETSAWSGRPWWWIVLGAVGVVALVYSLVMFF